MRYTRVFSSARFIFIVFLDTDINVTQEEFEQLFGESDEESSFKLQISFGNCAYTGSLLY